MKKSTQKILNCVAFVYSIHFFCGLAYAIFAQSFPTERVIQGDIMPLLDLQLLIGIFSIGFLTISLVADHFLHVNLIRMRFVFAVSLAFFLFLIAFKI